MSVYNVAVDTAVSDNSLSWSNGSTTLTNGYYDWNGTYHYHYYGCGCWGNGWTFSYPIVTTVYKYQLICPKCNTSNWGELDKIITCVGKNCGAKLKAVSQKVDYEIPVTAAA